MSKEIAIVLRQRRHGDASQIILDSCEKFTALVNANNAKCKIKNAKRALSANFMRDLAIT